MASRRDTRIESYVLDVLMRDLAGHDRKPSAFLVYLFLYRRTFAAGAHSTRFSLRRLAEATGLSKSAVQSALRWLARRKLLRVTHDFPTAVPEYFLQRPWASRRRL